ncbi:MAG: hypothetical protein H6631_04390 [Anaerolineaceae bacterium]|nr:hypothetical protein [Anaerolineaceae bacterium]
MINLGSPQAWERLSLIYLGSPQASERLGLINLGSPQAWERLGLINLGSPQASERLELIYLGPSPASERLDSKHFTVLMGGGVIDFKAIAKVALGRLGAAGGKVVSVQLSAFSRQLYR